MNKKPGCIWASSICTYITERLPIIIIKLLGRLNGEIYLPERIAI